MKRHAGLGLLLLLGLAPDAATQDYRWDKVEDLGIKFKVMRKLERVPLKLDGNQPNLKARYKPASEKDYIRGGETTYVWYLWAYEFVDAEVALDRGMTRRNDVAHAFHDFVKRTVDGREYRKFVVEGEPQKKNKAQGKKLPYTWWEYKDTQTSHLAATPVTWYVCAAVYDLGDREVALVTSMPLTKGDKLEPKYAAWGRNMLQSVTLLKDSERATKQRIDAKLYRFAETAAEKTAVSNAKANIASLDNWGIFTTESYIVLYSWPPKQQHKRRKHYQQAFEIARLMDQMRKLYTQYYPPEKEMVFPYSIMRICSTSHEFARYSDMSDDALLGWFSPKSKELVLFIDNDQELTKTVAFHEGWHQYSDTYFDVELQRWFDEGTGDYFGSYRYEDGKWRYDVSKMRKADIKAIVNSQEYVPLNEIITWSKSRFYDDNASAYYAQGYAMVDFLMRGAKERASGWDNSWGDILDKYRKTIREEMNPRQALDNAFEGVNWDKFTKAWVKWVKDY